MFFALPIMVVVVTRLLDCSATYALPRLQLLKRGGNRYVLKLSLVVCIPVEAPPRLSSGSAQGPLKHPKESRPLEQSNGKLQTGYRFVMSKHFSDCVRTTRNPYIPDTYNGSLQGGAKSERLEAAMNCVTHRFFAKIIW